METVTVSPKFQVVIPKEIREALKLTPGQKVQALLYENRIELIPVKGNHRVDTLQCRLHRSRFYDGLRRIGDQELVALIEQGAGSAAQVGARLEDGTPAGSNVRFEKSQSVQFGVQSIGCDPDRGDGSRG